MKKFRRVLALLLVVSSLLSVMSAAALADSIPARGSLFLMMLPRWAATPSPM